MEHLCNMFPSRLGPDYISLAVEFSCLKFTQVDLARPAIRCLPIRCHEATLAQFTFCIPVGFLDTHYL